MCLSGLSAELRANTATWKSLKSLKGNVLECLHTTSPSHMLTYARRRACTQCRHVRAHTHAHTDTHTYTRIHRYALTYMHALTQCTHVHTNTHILTYTHPDQRNNSLLFSASLLVILPPPSSCSLFSNYSRKSL